MHPEEQHPQPPATVAALVPRAEGKARPAETLEPADPAAAPREDSALGWASVCAGPHPPHGSAGQGREGQAPSRELCEGTHRSRGCRGNSCLLKSRGELTWAGLCRPL